ncbi:hypothetical protein K440DRAFT_635936 [Wilcoxina mikolae CBS 423.85]|nr:hypothetical protein K440DRAFT_635936 [Wilcoxina mikolae CBS 423.85]
MASRPGPLVPGAEHPEPDVVLRSGSLTGAIGPRSGSMTGAFGPRSGKAPALPPNDVEVLRAKPRAVTSVYWRQQNWGQTNEINHEGLSTTHGLISFEVPIQKILWGAKAVWYWLGIRLAYASEYLQDEL